MALLAYRRCFRQTVSLYVRLHHTSFVWVRATICGSGLQRSLKFIIYFLDPFARMDSSYCDYESAQFIHGVEGVLQRRLTRYIGVIRVRKNCAADLLAPAVVAEPCYPHAWVPIGRALLMVWMALVIHVVQQADRLPKIYIRAAKRCEMLHRVSNRVAMFSQAFRLDPIVKNRESAIGKCCHRR